MRILQIRVDACAMEQALEQVLQWLAGYPAPAQMQQIVTLNPEGVMLAIGDPSLQNIVEQAALVTADGNGLVWAAERYGFRGLQRLTGIDLMQQLCRLAAEQGWPVYLLGSKPGVAAAAAEKLQKQYPGLQIAGTENGYFRDREEQVISAIQKARPALLFAGLGMPFQEKWLAENAHRLGAAVAMGVGGSFDVICGNLKRAPQFMQKLRLEWLYRLLQQPSRWRRYLVLPRFMAAVRRDAKKTAKNR
ncbi:MAG: WecB/TagA/CpsF family glycosyltransferase [Firmicutes bacterium]|nr:WecB/TagA/CpsF family glycosyltransferase [Bacillota bacterium]